MIHFSGPAPSSLQEASSPLAPYAFSGLFLLSLTAEWSALLKFISFSPRSFSISPLSTNNFIPTPSYSLYPAPCLILPLVLCLHHLPPYLPLSLPSPPNCFMPPTSAQLVDLCTFTSCSPPCFLLAQLRASSSSS